MGNVINIRARRRKRARLSGTANAEQKRQTLKTNGLGSGMMTPRSASSAP